MELKKAVQRGRGIRVLSTGDLQIALSEKDRLNLLEAVYGDNPDLVDDLAVNSGDLRFIAEVTAIKTDVEQRHQWTGLQPLGTIELEFLWSYEENGDLQILRPEDIGALTSSVIIGLDTSTDDQGEVEFFPESKVFWYPNYMLRSFIEDLLINGETIFEGEH